MKHGCFPLVVVSALAGCVAVEPVTPSATNLVVQPATAVVAAPVIVAPAVVASPQYVVVPQQQVVAMLRPGMGRVDSITPLADTQRGTLNPLQRLGIRMEDGTAQYVDTRAPNIWVGQRIELTADSQMRYPIP